LPAIANTTATRNAVKTLLRAIFLASFDDSEAVSVLKTGITPRGFTIVKRDVNANKLY
jgi:hypothetical protein